MIGLACPPTIVDLLKSPPELLAKEGRYNASRTSIGTYCKFMCRFVAVVVFEKFVNLSVSLVNLLRELDLKSAFL